jgi:hypothetical protein
MKTVFVITVLDSSFEYDRCLAVWDNFVNAEMSVKGNYCDMADGGSEQYAVIEETVVNCTYPQIINEWWYEYNPVDDVYYPIDKPESLKCVSNFGIG